MEPLKDLLAQVRVCVICNIAKSEDEFYQRENGNLRRTCKLCENTKRNVKRPVSPEVGTEKVCSRCGILKPLSDFYENSRRPGITYKRCKVCDIALKKIAYVERRKDPAEVEKDRRISLEIYRKLKREVYQAYGGFKCVCCGETEESFLSLDHINDDGAIHRRSIRKNHQPKPGKTRGNDQQILIWLRQNNYPPIVQVLCMNCQWGKRRNGGICPHKEK